MTTMDTAVGSGRIPLRAKVIGFLELGKARLYHHGYGWLLAGLLLHRDGLIHPRTLLTLALGCVVVFAIQFAAGAADDLGGFRDGSDAQNYAGRPARTVAKKPLLTGVVTEREAVRFGTVAWIVGAVCTVLALATLDWRIPLPALALLIVVPVWAVQYSTGLKLSYRPFGLELTIFFVIGSIALLPYWLIAGHVSAEILLTSALVGLWFLMIVSYGNASDREGDAAVSRHTLAVLLPGRAYDVVLTALFLTSLGLLGWLFGTAHFGLADALVVLPVCVVHALQLYFGPVRQDWRRARLLGVRALDLGCLGLALGFLVF